MREIGAVVRLQIQRASLKTGEKPHRVYDPSPVLSVRRLAVDGDGVLGAGGAEVVRLSVLEVAHPCRPFTGWALGNVVESEVLKSHLQFLDGGTRGFYCQGERGGIVSIGDRVVLIGR